MSFFTCVFIYLLKNFFWLHVKLPQPGGLRIKSVPPAVEASLNHWTTREVLEFIFNKGFTKV